MPASMIIADAGGRPNVKGSSIATVVSGEMPGSTPTSVPIVTPTRQNSRFCQVAAVARPSARLSSSSTGYPSPGAELGQVLRPELDQERRPELEWQAEPPDEEKRRERGEQRAEQDEPPPLHRSRRRPGRQHAADAGGNQAEGCKQHRKHRDSGKDRRQRPPRRLLQRLG